MGFCEPACPFIPLFARRFLSWETYQNSRAQVVCVKFSNLAGIGDVGRGRRGAPVQRSAVRARPPSSGHGPQGLFLVLPQMVHVQIARGFQPVLVHLHGQCPDQPQTALGIGEDAHDRGAAFDLLVQTAPACW